MTTIVTDGRIIAADSLATAGNTKVMYAKDKIMVGGSDRGGPAVFAVSGHAAMLPPLARWVERGMLDEPPKATGENSEWNLLIIDRGGARRIESGVPHPFEVSFPHAMGSGRDFALAAMDAGASPERAVEIAISRDVWSGGEIQVVDICRELGIEKKTAAE